MKRQSPQKFRRHDVREVTLDVTVTRHGPIIFERMAAVTRFAGHHSTAAVEFELSMVLIERANGTSLAPRSSNTRSTQNFHLPLM